MEQGLAVHRRERLGGEVGIGGVRDQRVVELGGAPAEQRGPLEVGPDQGVAGSELPARHLEQAGRRRRVRAPRRARWRGSPPGRGRGRRRRSSSRPPRWRRTPRAGPRWPTGRPASRSGTRDGRGPSGRGRTARSPRNRPSSTPGLIPGSNRRMNLRMARSPTTTELLDCSAETGVMWTPGADRADQPAERRRHPGQAAGPRQGPAVGEHPEHRPREARVVDRVVEHAVGAAGPQLRQHRVGPPPAQLVGPFPGRPGERQDIVLRLAEVELDPGDHERRHRRRSPPALARHRHHVEQRGRGHRASLLGEPAPFRDVAGQERLELPARGPVEQGVPAAADLEVRQRRLAAGGLVLEREPVEAVGAERDEVRAARRRPGRRGSRTARRGPRRGTWTGRARRTG